MLANGVAGYGCCDALKKSNQDDINRHDQNGQVQTKLKTIAIGKKQQVPDSYNEHARNFLKDVLSKFLFSDKNQIAIKKKIFKIFEYFGNGHKATDVVAEGILSKLEILDEIRKVCLTYKIFVYGTCVACVVS